MRHRAARVSPLRPKAWLCLQSREGGSQIAKGVSPTVDPAVGNHTITLEVTDNHADADTDEVIGTVSPPSSAQAIVDRLVYDNFKYNIWWLSTE